MKLLLDTCTFLWAVADKSRLSTRCRELITAPSNEVFLSAASVWEICIKHKLGNLNLAEPPAEFVPKYRARHGYQAIPIAEEDALQLSRLPEIHKDQFDRMLVCQAIARGLAIVTPDPLIAQYPVRTLW